MDLPGGNYYVQARLKVSDNSSSSTCCKLKVLATRDGSEQVIAQRDIAANEFRQANEWEVMMMPVNINEDDTNVKIQVEFVAGVCDVMCDWIRVVPFGSLHTGLFQKGGIRDADAFKTPTFLANSEWRSKFQTGFVNADLIAEGAVIASKLNVLGIDSDGKLVLTQIGTKASELSDLANARTWGGATLPIVSEIYVDFANRKLVSSTKDYNGRLLTELVKSSSEISVDGIIQNGVITTAKLADGAITTAKIADLAITAAKLADGAVSTSKIADGAITTVKIASGAITTDKVSDYAITFAKLESPVQKNIGRFWEGEDYDGDTGSDVEDSTASEGWARKALSTDSSGILVEVS